MKINLTGGDILIHLGIEIVVGLVVSFLFLRYILFYLRPRIVISPEIAIEVNENDKTKIFWFKIINQSRWQGFELEFGLEVLSLEPTSNGCYHLQHEKEIPLVRGSFPNIPAYQSNRHIRKHSTSAPHCFQVRTMVDLQEIVKDRDRFIGLHVSVKHGLSGIFKAFDQRYTRSSTIKVGSFAFGNQLDVIPSGS